MSVTLASTIGSIIISITGLFVVKSISGSKNKILCLRNISLLLCLIVLSTIIHNMEYQATYTISIYIITIIIYKYILDISYIKSTLSCGILLFFIIILDFLGSCMVVPFVSAETARNSWYIIVPFHIIYSIILIFLFYKTKIGTWISEFVSKIELKKPTKIILFFLLVITVLSITFSILTNDFTPYLVFTKGLLIFSIVFLLVMILFLERNNYEKLSDEYDSLFNYVKIFEDWIEKEQFIRHEYKNQLAVLRCMTKEQKVKEKIDSIIAENINIDSVMISELKCLPSGGLKGLLYYKIAVAKNKNVNIEIDISNEVAIILKKLKSNQLKTLSKLLGVYLDNAIEAALETKKKIVSIEIYQYNNIVRFVISNTFNLKKDISQRHEKGISTKGKNRGYGLYFANKLLLNNKWINYTQDIIDNFYIVKLSIDNTNKKV